MSATPPTPPPPPTKPQHTEEVPAQTSRGSAATLKGSHSAKPPSSKLAKKTETVQGNRGTEGQLCKKLGGGGQRERDG